MDRAEYLKMCQKISVLKDGVGGIKKDIPPELLVKFHEITYYPLEYKLSFDKGNVRHTAILHDLQANAIINASLERVERVTVNE